MAPLRSRKKFRRKCAVETAAPAKPKQKRKQRLKQLELSEEQKTEKLGFLKSIVGEGLK